MKIEPRRESDLILEQHAPQFPPIRLFPERRRVEVGSSSSVCSEAAFGVPDLEDRTVVCVEEVRFDEGKVFLAGLDLRRVEQRGGNGEL